MVPLGIGHYQVYSRPGCLVRKLSSRDLQSMRERQLVSWRTWMHQHDCFARIQLFPDGSQPLVGQIAISVPVACEDDDAIGIELIKGICDHGQCDGRFPKEPEA